MGQSSQVQRHTEHGVTFHNSDCGGASGGDLGGGGGGPVCGQLGGVS